MSLSELLLEGAPPAGGRPLWWRALRHWSFRWRRTWRGSLAANLAYPVLYLAAMGVGLGGLVDHHVAGHAAAAGLGGVSYLDFVTPGILAGSVMQIGVHESTWPVMGGVRWERTYFSQLASPIGPVDAFLGHLAFLAFRALVAAALFVAIAWGFGALPSPEAVVAVPIAVVVAVAFGAPIAAFAVTRENDSAFSTIQRLVIVPLFLFSGSFFPIAQLPAFLRVLALCTPLYHGVALERAATLGRLFTPVSLVHLAYLVGLTLLGIRLAGPAYRRRLTS